MPRQPRDTYKAHQHWVYEAHQQKEARALGDKLGLSFPNGSAGGPESDFMYDFPYFRGIMQLSSARETKNQGLHRLSNRHIGTLSVAS